MRYASRNFGSFKLPSKCNIETLHNEEADKLAHAAMELTETTPVGMGFNGVMSSTS